MNRDTLPDEHNEMILYDGLDEALVGYSNEEEGTVAVYNYERMVDVFMKNNDWPQEEAIEWIEFNVLGGYLGPRTPLIIYDFHEDLH